MNVRSIPKKTKTALKRGGVLELWRVVSGSFLDSLSPRRRKYFQELARIDDEFDHERGTDTGGIISSWDLGGVLGSAEDSYPYEATNPTELRSALHELHLDYTRYTFVDVGSGKGRALLVAAEFPFRAVLGVEHAQILHEIAVQNIRRDRGPRLCRDVKSILSDATTYSPPQGSLVLFIFNPFQERIVGCVLEKLHSTQQTESDDVQILYKGQSQPEFFNGFGFRKIAQHGDLILYRRKETGSRIAKDSNHVVSTKQMVGCDKRPTGETQQCVHSAAWESIPTSTIGKRLRTRTLHWGWLRTLAYYMFAVIPEKLGVTVLRVYEFVGPTMPPTYSHGVTFSILRSPVDLTVHDHELMGQRQDVPEFKRFVEFMRGNTISIVARWHTTKLVSIGYVDNTTDYPPAGGNRSYFIHNCFTLLDYRGQGIYPQLLFFACNHLRSGIGNSYPIYVDCSFVNYASIRGIEKAGFARVGTMIKVLKHSFWWRSAGAPKLKQ